MHTPWGASDSSEQIAPGIVFYGTPSHGGYHLSRGRVALLPKVLRGGVDGYQPEWWEEDCCAALVVLAFPECFPEASYVPALECAERWHPEVLEDPDGELDDRLNEAAANEWARTRELEDEVARFESEGGAIGAPILGGELAMVAALIGGA